MTAHIGHDANSLGYVSFQAKGAAARSWLTNFKSTDTHVNANLERSSDSGSIPDTSTP